MNQVFTVHLVRESPQTMPHDGDSVGGGDLGEVLYPEPSCSTRACGFGPFSPSSLHAELCCFPCIVSAPATVKGDEKQSQTEVK